LPSLPPGERVIPTRAFNAAGLRKNVFSFSPQVPSCSENNRKNGNPYLAWAYIEAATFAARYSARTQAWYERKKNRRNVAVAKKALACKLAKAVWHVMKGNNFDERMLFG